eukprot:12344445-Ditylum_brightwellii.AAC.1
MRDELSQEERKKAPPLLMFIKEKQDGRIKGRTCADGRKQHIDSKKGDAASPTVSIESVLISATIDGHERRKVATTDIP